MKEYPVEGGAVRHVDFKTSEFDSLPTDLGEGAEAYCYEGTDKGKWYKFTGTSWEYQFTVE